MNEKLEREEIFTYDSIGRIESKTLKKGKLSKLLRYFYDGSHGKVENQSGFLTRLEGENFIKTWKYRIDGKIEVSTIEFIRENVQLELHYDYFDNHLLKSIDTIASSSNKSVSYSKEYIYDELNRLEKVLINGRETLAIDYNKQNKASKLNFISSKKSVTPLYDQVTGSNLGYDSKENGYSFSYNDRGFIRNETFGSHSRDYLYDDRGYLESYEGLESDSYSYSDSGFRDFFSESLETFSRILEDNLSKPSQRIGFDTMGRVKVFGGAHFIYGTDGNLAKASRSGVEARYIYDESDQRLASFYEDKVLFKYDDFSIVLSKDNLQVFNPVKVAGYTVGILTNGEFEAHFSDLRGTVLDSGSWSSPYGVRKGVLTKFEIIDFINQGRDPVTGFIRFGKRDYSPELGSFTTPDPLFLEKPENCIKSPIECNLYSYAKNNPLKYVDPTGKSALPAAIRQDPQFWNDLKGTMKVYWDTLIAAPYKMIGNTSPAFDAVTVSTGKDISGIVDFDNLTAKNKTIPNASTKQKAISFGSLFLGPALKTMSKITKVKAGLIFLEGGMNHKTFDLVYDTAEGLDTAGDTIGTLYQVRNTGVGLHEAGKTILESTTPTQNQSLINEQSNQSWWD